jgi:hypothetical protein
MLTLSWTWRGASSSNCHEVHFKEMNAKSIQDWAWNQLCSPLPLLQAGALVGSMKMSGVEVCFDEGAETSLLRLRRASFCPRRMAREGPQERPLADSLNQFKFN